MSSGTERTASPSRLLADLEQAISAGHILQSSQVAVLLGCSESALMQKALVPGTAAVPGTDERLQRYLRNVVHVLCVAERHFGGLQAALRWYQGDPGAPGRRPRPDDLVAAGLLEDAYRLLLRASQDRS